MVTPNTGKDRNSWRSNNFVCLNIISTAYFVSAADVFSNRDCPWLGLAISPSYQDRRRSGDLRLPDRYRRWRPGTLRLHIPGTGWKLNSSDQKSSETSIFMDASATHMQRPARDYATQEFVQLRETIRVDEALRLIRQHHSTRQTLIYFY